MATLSYYLKKRKGIDEYPLYLRVTHNRKSRFIPTDVALKESNWNSEKEEVRKSHALSKVINNYLTRKKLNAKQVVLHFNERRNGFTVEELKQAISRNGTEIDQDTKQEEEQKPDFFEYATDVIKDYKATLSHHRWKSFNTVVNKVRKFWKKEDLPFEEITVEFLRKYEVYCMENRGNKANTVKSNLKKVRKIFNDAIKEGVIPGDMYPFRYYTMPSNPVVKPKLTIDEIEALRSVDTKKGTRLFDTQNIFMFAYYCWGMRFRDVCRLKWSHIKGDRLIYIMSKTGKRMSIGLNKHAREILSYYKPEEKVNKEQYLFPFLNHHKDYSDKEYYENQISSKNALVNKYLTKLKKQAGIVENISFHIARHSFAQRCLEKDLRLIEIRDLLGHKKITTTIQYLKSLGNEHLDKTARGIFT